jgi:endonuclease-3
MQHQINQSIYQHVNQHADDIFKIFAQCNPNPKIELNYTNLFTLAIAVILSAQATDKRVNKVTAELFKICQSPEEIIALGENNLRQYIRSIGLYNNKTHNILKLSQILVERFNSVLPTDFNIMITLPGIGRKTANVILNTWLDYPCMPVDTHLFRTSKRLNLAFGSTPQKVEQELMINIPSQWQILANRWLVLHGRYICKAIKPKCNECIIRHFCPYVDQNIK